MRCGLVLWPGDAQGLSTEEETIASLLKDAGYATRLVGKWHCGNQPQFLPTRHGFDGYFGLPYSNDMGRQAPLGQHPPLPLLRDAEVVEEQPDQASLTERYVEDAVRFMREQAPGPFFLYFAHMYVHLPLYVPDRFVQASRNGRYGAAVAAIDGIDLGATLLGNEPDGREEFFYYLGDQLEAVRVGRWKLHVRKRVRVMRELYDLGEDVGETTDLSAGNPAVVADLAARLDRMAERTGDSARAIMGIERRPSGRVTDPAPLTTFDPDHPYFESEYDLEDSG